MKQSKSDKIIAETYGENISNTDEELGIGEDEVVEPGEPDEAMPLKKRDRKKVQSGQDSVVEDIPKQEMVLYIITDKPITGELRYYREAGLGVSSIFTNVEEARGRLLMQSKSTRIAIIDTGTGKFMTTSIRKELIDMIGANDEDNKFTVFYTDTALKSETMRDIGKMGKTIEWVQYESTAAMVAYMLQHHEKYILQRSADKIEEESDESALGFIGVKAKCTEGERLVLALSGETITRNIFNEQEEQIPGFEIRL